MTSRLALPLGPAVAAILAACALAFALPAAAPAAGAAPRQTPTLSLIRCVPATLKACKSGPRATVGQRLQLRGTRFKRGMRVSFRWSRGALATKLAISRTGWTVRVPAGVAPGRVDVTVTDSRGRRSNKRRITVMEPAGASRPTVTDAGALPQVFAGNGMWIWYVSQSDDGDLDRIAARAKASGIGTVFVKSADGAKAWTQFTPGLVNGLRARGLKVCAWQFVYGADPLGEAAAAAESVKAGADCFVIDAETQYEGRYAAASRYVTALRAAIGPAYPVGLTSFPYVDYHPKLPYSVFLAPGAAQVNLPQVYWKDIGGSVDAVSAKTFATNRVYGVPIAPLGQTYGSPAAADLQRFRALWAGYGSGGLSWWSWQATPAAGWTALTPAAPATITPPDPGFPALDARSSGDLVIWLQQHLKSHDPSVVVNGRVTSGLLTSLKAFQAAKGLEATGETDAATWQALLALPVTPVDWS